MRERLRRPSHGTWSVRKSEAWPNGRFDAEIVLLFDRYAYLKSKRPIDAQADFVAEQLMEGDGWSPEVRKQHRAW